MSPTTEDATTAEHKIKSILWTEGDAWCAYELHEPQVPGTEYELVGFRRGDKLLPKTERPDPADLLVLRKTGKVSPQVKDPDRVYAQDASPEWISSLSS